MDAFWSGGFDFGSPVASIDDVLAQRNFSLEDLLGHVDVVSECKYLNSNLISYLARREVVEALVQYVIATPPEGKDEGQKSMFPYVASELFACEVVEILNVFFENPDLLTLLFSFLDAPAPLSPGDCAYFCKVVVVLITKKHSDLLEFIRNNGILDKVLNHIGVYSIMELLIRIGWDDGTGASQYDDDSDMEAHWLQQEKLVSKLVSKLDPAYDILPEVHTNAACAMVDAVVKSSPMIPKTALLVSELQSKPILDVLFSHMFSGNASSLTNSLSVAIVLVQSCTDQRMQEPQELGAHQPPILAHVIESFPKLLAILKDSPKSEVKTQHGAIQACGPSRLKIVELILALVRCVAEDDVTDNVAKVLIETNSLSAVLDLFAVSPWNNLLHGLVEGIIHTILDVQEHDEPVESASLVSLRKHMFGPSSLLSRILDAFRKNLEALAQPKGSRLGYMGHIIRLTSILQASYSNHALRQFGANEEEVKKWDEFLSGPFQQDFHQQQIVLGGRHPAMGPVPQMPEDDGQDLDGLQLNGMLEPESQFRGSSYDPNQYEDDDDDDDDFFNWEAREQPEANDSDDSDDAILQEVAPPPPKPEQSGQL